MKAMCSVDGCGRMLLARGYCESHYYRYRRYGDPSAGGAIEDRGPSVPSRDILAAIVDHMSRHNGQAPSFEEVGAACGISSVSVVSYRLGLLAKEGLISLGGRGKSRSIGIPGSFWLPPANIAAIVAGPTE